MHFPRSKLVLHLAAKYVAEVCNGWLQQELVSQRVPNYLVTIEGDIYLLRGRHAVCDSSLSPASQVQKFYIS